MENVSHYYVCIACRLVLHVICFDYFISWDKQIIYYILFNIGEKTCIKYLQFT